MVPVDEFFFATETGQHIAWLNDREIEFTWEYGDGTFWKYEENKYVVFKFENKNNAVMFKMVRG